MSKPLVVSATGWSYFPLAFAARFPFAMLVVGVLTFVVDARGSVALGGLNSAAVGLGTALCGPFLGYAADRFGQRITLSIAAIANSGAIILLVAVVSSDAPTGGILASAFLVGMTAPQVGPMSRTRLVHAVNKTYPPAKSFRVLNSVMAYESAVDEIVFVIGPVGVGVLAVAFSPMVAVYAAAGMTLVFVMSFALHRTGRIDVAEQEVAGRANTRAIFSRGIVVAALGTLGMGFFFGSTLTSLTAYLNTTGSANLTGVIYGCVGVGSTVLALSVSFFPDSFRLSRRWFYFSLVMVVGALGFATIHSIGFMCASLVITGVGIGPTLVTIYSIGSERAPIGTTATTMTILGSSVVLGQSLAAALTGSIAESWGAGAAMYLPLVAAAVVCGAGIWNMTMPERTAEKQPELLDALN